MGQVPCPEVFQLERGQRVLQPSPLASSMKAGAPGQPSVRPSDDCSPGWQLPVHVAEPK